MTLLSGIQPTGAIHLGNYLGAVRRWATAHGRDDMFFVVDLHAMTVPHHPGRLRARTREQLAVLLAAGIDPDVACVFVQSDLVDQLGALTWLLESTCTFGEANRMTQFKEKSEGQASVRLSLLTYPVLMAADILLHGADEVPVGEDQTQHLELARTLARRFNNTYGEVFTVPRGVLPQVAARVRDLADPTRKMAKSSGDSPGTIYLLDPPDTVRRKIQRAVTDTVGEVRYDPERQPGVANLLEILAACTGVSPYTAAGTVDSYAALKAAVADAVVETLRPVRERTVELLDDPAELDRVRRAGAERARRRAQPRLDAALEVVGLR
ncbi:tryptophanyl-tRNA synthetase [Streptoalloteichus tenebrarius]|uniref:Tryptophan--tRNA ligase n=1 Tax=Streptoalloteichus tenebrarius (strain ATCC 17920 / DSM 40477 / JCM 4838 / CBS 697.72 / NBRC 16177 / NCIMB 11028 / NRRL B-12390 / A12253. 1 / ISP 5477) TaxID=1933 RepID=A0ABT1I397_STRSD|nr:tryptophan--tRNA ligase [Streptoalloteichus tenebrarius]MCP2262234.1 tryptophanyl-tRNA synthetase [Streptoalloteichus tenebrarius]BFF01099.1 tryptophan--tRNA ligase [Streptoalloteichus tenebrarius]